MAPSTCDRCPHLIVRSSDRIGQPSYFFASYKGQDIPPREFYCLGCRPPRYISPDMPPIPRPDWCPHIVRNKP